MALTTRQTNLLVQQDWTKIYQTFKEADFQSYDFETLRKTMIDYLRTYYPEDFNDFIESSEYVALIDLIAFLGQSLAFRTDLNARENFIDTAERRDSVLKLARLINYSPKRNIPATGFLKIDSITTTESVTDSNGSNLASLIISWNDSTNSDWQEQFNAIINAALLNSQVVGKPGNSQTINNIQTDEYTLSIESGVTPVFRFTSAVEGSDMTFEAVSATSINSTYIYEVEPKPSAKFNILYRNDNLGNGSKNTGFFVYFKQGAMNSIDFNLAESLPNRTVNINFDNINNNDTWLYSISAQNAISDRWQQVPAVAGVNIAYNKSSDRNLYQVNTRVGDQIDLIFGDGSFANVPKGRFRFYYRQSNGLTYKITPDEMQNISIPIPYVSRSGRTEILTLRASLNYTVANATARETLEEIRNKAPQQYYTQNRMITGEDYNIFPYTAFSTVLKAKAVNRTSSGVSRFLDVLDVTGKYSSTNIFAADGILYKDEFIKDFQFSYQTSNEIFNVIYNQIRPIVTGKELQHFYYSRATRYSVSDIRWQALPGGATNSGPGKIIDVDGDAVGFGAGTSGELGYVKVGSMLRFVAGEGKYFTGSNKLVTGSPRLDGDRNYIYATVISSDSTNRTMKLNQLVPTGAILDQIIPVFKNNLSESFVQQVANYIKVYQSFGIKYNALTSDWEVIPEINLSLSDEYSESGSGVGNDSSWLIKLTSQGRRYTVSYRGLDYYFESSEQTRFYFDNKVKVFDSKTGRTINDQISVLRFNTQPDSSYPLYHNMVWYIYKNVVESDGHENNRKILVTFPDSDNDGVPDDPDLFESIVNPSVDTYRKYVFFRAETQSGNFVDYFPIDSGVIDTTSPDLPGINLLLDNNLDLEGQIFYAYYEDKFYKIVDGQAIEVFNYISKIGRQDLSFRYQHNSPNQRRIDPSPNNIIDFYILTKTYANEYLEWIRDTSNSKLEPAAPSSEDLKLEFSTLENYKAMSDSLIYNSAKFKPVFGSRASSSLRAKFKVIKNPNIIVSDSDIKTSVIAAINSYFDLNNWDFGETFYFSELGAYLHNRLSPDIASVIIVSADSNMPFGNLYQITAEPDEIIVSAATVDDVEIISSITASQINQIGN